MGIDIEMLTQAQKEKAAQSILVYSRLGGEKLLQETIDKLDLIINPHLTTPTGSTAIRDKIEVLIKDYASGTGKYSLEATIREIAGILQSIIKPKKTINLLPPTGQKPLQANKYFSSTSRFTQDQIDTLNLSTITKLQHFTYVLESVIDERCIYKTDFFMDSYGNHSYHVEFTDVGRNMVLFQFTRTSSNKGLSPNEIILGVLKSFYDSYSATCQGVLKYDHLTGKIEVL